MFSLECELTNISCRILHHLTRKDTFDFRDSTDIKNVASQFNQGTISGYIYIHGNFSDMFFKRLLQPVDLDLDTINQSTMQVIMTFFLMKPLVSEICVIYVVFLNTFVYSRYTFHNTVFL